VTLARAIAVLGVTALAAGCTAVVGGEARPAPNVTARPLSGPVIKQVLLDDAALSTLLQQPFKTDAHFPPRFGGPDQLQDDGPASSVGCLGVAVMLQRTVYQSARVQGVAVESWLHAARSVKVISVKEGVISLPTGADADALFAKFSEQWRNCAGTTLPLPGSAVRVTAKITDVRDANSVLATTVSMELTVPSSDPAAILEGRAIGVRGNCLVEVEVDFFNTSNPSHRGSGDVDTSATEIAHAMLDRVSALS
jgi:PknH-like extracellular domain